MKIHFDLASLIIPLLADIVSKNGNLLLNIPLPGHGEPDSDEIAFLDELAQWQQVNREAIKDTRPWKIYREGPSTRAGQITAYQLSKLKFDHTDIRFTSKGETLHYPRSISQVDLLGATSAVKWTRGSRGLEIELPGVAPSEYAVAFRIVPR